MEKITATVKTIGKNADKDPYAPIITHTEFDKIISYVLSEGDEMILGERISITECMQIVAICEVIHEIEVHVNFIWGDNGGLWVQFIGPIPEGYSPFFVSN